MVELLKRFRCPACQAMKAVVTQERFGVVTFFCPACEHVWEDHVKRRATSRQPASGARAEGGD
jgi:Zn-finger nucleic acid-binding protein